MPEHRTVVVDADQNRVPTLVADHHGDAGVEVGDQEDPGRTPTDLHDPADEPFSRQDALPAPDAIGRTGVDQQRTGEGTAGIGANPGRSEEHQPELQSLLRNSYAV